MSYFFRYIITDGTAKDGSDYVMVQGAVEFNPNVATQSIKVKILDDYEFEPDEHFLVKLEKGPDEHYVTIGRNLTRVVIGNDDREYTRLFGPL